MAIVNCKECGEIVSTQADACPKCGARRAGRGGLNPWKIIGWIFLAFLALILYSCVRVAGTIGSSATTGSPPSSSPAFSTAAPVAPPHKADVLSFQCEQQGNYDVGKATIRNTGTTTIPYAKFFVEFVDRNEKVVGAGDTYFSPTDIPPGATASADVMERSTGGTSCRPSAFQDGDGNPIDITMK